MQKSARRKAAVLVTTGAAAMAFGLGPGAVTAHAFDDWDDKGCAQRDGWDDRGRDDRGRDYKGWKDGDRNCLRDDRDKLRDDGWDRGEDGWKDSDGKDGWKDRNGKDGWDKGDRVKDDEWEWDWDW